MRTLNLTLLTLHNYLVLEKTYFLSCNMTPTVFFLFQYYTFLLNKNEKLRLFQAIKGYFASHMSHFMNSYCTQSKIILKFDYCLQEDSIKVWCLSYQVHFTVSGRAFRRIRALADQRNQNVKSFGDRWMERQTDGQMEKWFICVRLLNM